MSRLEDRGLPRAIVLAPTDGSLALTRALGRRRVPASILFHGRLQWAAKTRHAERYALGQLPGDRKGWLDRLSVLAQEGDGVLVPATDRLSEFLVRDRSHIPARLRSFEGPDSAHMALIEKGSLYALAERAGVRYPWTLRLDSQAELERVAEEASYPCVLKPALSHEWRRLIGGVRALVIAGRDDLVRKAARPLDLGLGLLVSEYVPGPDRNLEGAVTIRRNDGSYGLAYGLRKLRAYPPGFGTGAVHETDDVPETMTLATRLLDEAGFVGVSHVETKRHAGTGELVLIEVNARLPRCWGLADAAGTDASWRLYSTLAGLPLGVQPAPREGIVSIAPSLEPRAVVANLSERRLSLRELLDSYRRLRDVSGLSLRDPGPILVLAARQLYGLVRWARRKARRT